MAPCEVLVIICYQMWLHCCCNDSCCTVCVPLWCCNCDCYFECC